MYAIRLCNVNEKRIANGIVQREKATDHFKYDKYKQVLLTGEQTTTHFSSITSKDMELKTVSVDKVALSPYDDKRYVVYIECVLF